MARTPSPISDQELLSALLEIGEFLGSGSEFEDSLRSILKVLSDRLRMHRGTLSLLQEDSEADRREVAIDIAYGLSQDEIERGRYKVGEGITGRVVASGKPVIVPGDGTSFWVACHRDDVARAFVGAVGNPQAYGRAYHVTGEEWLTWDAYHRVVAEALAAPRPTLVHIPTDLLGAVVPKRAEWCVENFHYNNLFDNSAARADLGFRYTLPFAEGARRVIAWREAHGGFENSDDQPFYDRILDAWQRLGTDMARELEDIE